jgi:hypothetical protein
MKYQIVLQYRDPRTPERVSTITRDSDEEAREAAKRWARLVCNAAGPNDPKPAVWFLLRLGVDDMFTPFEANSVDSQPPR